MNHEYMKYAEAAAFLSVPVGTLYAMVSRRTIPHVRISRRLVRFSKTALERWLEGRTTAADDEGVAAPRLVTTTRTAKGGE